MATHISDSECFSSSQHVDLESQQKKSFKDHCFTLVLMLRVQRGFISILTSTSSSIQSSPTDTYTALLSSSSATAYADESSPAIYPDDQVHIDVPELEADNDDHHISVAAKDIDIANEIKKMVEAKDLSAIQNFGGVQGVAEALRRDLKKGRTLICPGEDHGHPSAISTAELAPSSTRRFFGFIIQSSQNINILLLFLCAVLSFGFGIKEDGLKTGWQDGAIIMIAIIILVVAPSIRDFLRAQKVHKPLEPQVVEVIREGSSTEISISDLMIGDIICLKSEARVPADGLFISGDVLVVHDGLEYSTVDEKTPFLFYGLKVINGSGQMIITSVGMDTVLTKMMKNVGNSTPYSQTSLLAQLDKVGSRTQIAGLSISIVILVVLLLRSVVAKTHADSDLPEIKKTIATKDYMDIVEKIVMKPRGKISTFITSLNILLIGTQEPVALVIVFTIIYLTKKVFSGKAHSYQDLLASVKMGSVNVIICTDRLYRPEVAKCYVGENIIQKDCITDEIPRHVREALCICIGTPISKPTTPCKSFEDPLLPWAASQLGTNMENLKQSCSILKMKSLNSNEEGSEVELMRKLGSDNERVRYQYWKGPAKTILAMCSHYYKITGEIQDMEEDKRGALKNIIEQMQSDNLETIAFSYKKIDVVDKENGIILVGMVGLEKSCSAEIHDAVKAYHDAGVKIVLTSEHNVSDMEDRACKCGLELPDQSEKSVVDGEVFRKLTDTVRMDLAGNIIVMGNSHPSDTLLLVQCLKKKGNVVAMLGTKSTSSPALKEADVGIAMGFWSSEMARENSDFIIHNGNFSLLVKHTCRGRCIYNNILKYIQLDLAMTIAGTSITLITTASLGHAPITGIQLIMANLVVNLLGGFALLSEPPTYEQMHKPPVSPTQPFISKLMWRNIVSQALYQTTILVTFYFRGKDLLDLHEQVCKSIVFNSFVLCQVFNLLNSRELEKRSVFKGLVQNPCFGLAVVFILIPQIAFIEVENIIVGNTMLINLAQWGVALLIGSTSLLVDSAVKYCTSTFIFKRTRPPLLFGLRHHHAGSVSLTVTVSVPDRDSPSVSGPELPSITEHEADNSTLIVSRTQPLHFHLV